MRSRAARRCARWRSVFALVGGAWQPQMDYTTFEQIKPFYRTMPKVKSGIMVGLARWPVLPRIEATCIAGLPSSRILCGQILALLNAVRKTVAFQIVNWWDIPNAQSRLYSKTMQ